jgi:hypothetical protein
VPRGARLHRLSRRPGSLNRPSARTLTRRQTPRCIQTASTAPRPRCRRFPDAPKGLPSAPTVARLVRQPFRPPFHGPRPASERPSRPPGDFPPPSSRRPPPRGSPTGLSGDLPPLHGLRPRLQDTRRSPFRTTAAPLRPAPSPHSLPSPKARCSRASGSAWQPPASSATATTRGRPPHRRRRPLLRRPPTSTRGPTRRSFPRRRLRPLRPADFWVVLPPISTNSFGKGSHDASAPSRPAFRALLHLRVRCHRAAV